MKALCLMLAAASLLAVENFDRPNFNTYRDATIEGKAFGQGPEQNTRACGERIGNWEGKHLLSSGGEGDALTGRVLLAPFVIEADYLSFLISGGRHPGRTTVNLLVDGQIVRSATGHNQHSLRELGFDLREFRKQEARIEILDRHTGAWGHINVDHFQLVEQPPARIVNEPATGLSAVAVTRNGRHQGEISCSASGLRIYDSAISGLLHLIVDSEPTLGPHALRLANGDLLRGKLTEIRDGHARLETSLLGKLEIPLAEIAGFEFSPEIADSATVGTLFRVTGEPIPGKLVWMRKDSFAIDCALGVIPVPREGLLRYYLRTPQALRASALTLTDGSQLHGDVRFGDNVVAIGEHEIPFSALSQLDIVNDDTQSLATLSFEEQRQPGPVGLSPAARFRSRPVLGAHSFRQYPNSTAKFAISANATGFRALLAPVSGAKGPVIASIHCLGRRIYARTVVPAATPVLLALDTPIDGDLEFRVEFADSATVPCGVDWCDPYLVKN
jgi:hypothetical protein